MEKERRKSLLFIKFAKYSTKKVSIMKKMLTIAAILALCLQVSAQSVPPGAAVYSLPRTTITLTVTADVSVFTAGPYAQYAAKYLGNTARTVSGTSCTIKSIKVIPSVEADPNERYAINLSEKSAATFLQLSSQGLVAMSDSNIGRESDWRFASTAGAEKFIGKDPEGNLENATATLYRAVMSEEGFEQVEVLQSQVVEKSLEKKAQEAAKYIFSLREKKFNIVTGDTDATFSGEALQAAITEINRLEKQYLSLFYGITEVSEQTVSFDVVPQKGVAKYTAFKISDAQGLVPATSAQGKAVTLEISTENLSAPGANGAKSSGGSAVYYRIPAVALCKVVDAGKVLLEERVPVYQFGETISFPVNSLLK